MKEENKSELTLAQRFVTMVHALGSDHELLGDACLDYMPHVIDVDWEPHNGSAHVVVFSDHSGAMFTAEGEIKAGFMKPVPKANTMAEQFERVLSTTEVETPERNKAVEDMWDGVVKTIHSGNDYMLIFKDLSCILCSKKSGDRMETVTYTKNEMLKEVIGAMKESLGM